MYDVAIVGAGLSGLALAEMFEAQGQSVLLLEARERLGGRILTQVDPETGLAIDLGPAWFWPHRQPHVAAMVQRFELLSFPQWDQGANLILTDVDRGPQRAVASPNDGAHRIAGGMARLVEALAARLLRTDIRTGHVLQALFDEATHVRLAWCSGNGPGEALARSCVMAMPPRLVASLTFSPGLDRAILSGLQHLPTWMAASAKAVMVCARSFWREQGLSGSAFVTHEQAVLAEIRDACDAAGDAAALIGFLALSPGQRRDFAEGLPMLIASQFTQLFGDDADGRRHYYQDWACEAFTCAVADLAQAPSDHPQLADDLLRSGHWGGKLHFAGAETAARDPGYMEGAIESAHRVVQSMRDAHERAELMTRPVNAAALASFGQWLEGQRGPVFFTYRATLSRSLMRQQREQLTQRALLAAVEEALSRALAEIGGLRLDRSEEHTSELQSH